MSPSLLLLDVDNTLYPPSRGVVERVDALINRYLVERVGIDAAEVDGDRKSTRLNSSHGYISYAVFCLKKKKRTERAARVTRILITSSSLTTRHMRRMR